jgi:DNA modification methylase
VTWDVRTGDALEVLRTYPNDSFDVCITSPPYWGLRDYAVAGQLGLEKTPEEYVANLVSVFREVKRVLRSDGTLWLNLGDSYAASVKGTGGHQSLKVQIKGRRNFQEFESGPRKFDHGLKPKDLVGIPWRVAFALQADGWYLRSDIIWHKPNPMPESVTDRPTKAHEYIFLFAKSEKYYYDALTIKEKTKPGTKPASNKPGTLNVGRLTKEGWAGDPQRSVPEYRNRRTVWTVTTKPFKGAHFATFPPDLIEPCVLAGSRKEGTVLDPFAGAGTTGVVALKHGRKFLGIELNPEYVEIARRRIGVC